MIDGPTGIAWAYAALGEKDAAFRLQEDYRRRIGGLAKVEPKFESLRSDPRFAELLQKMNLTPLFLARNSLWVNK